MNKMKHKHCPEEGQNFIVGPHPHGSRWKIVHHSWSFWIFLALMMFAISYYVFTVDFAFTPRITEKVKLK